MTASPSEHSGPLSEHAAGPADDGGRPDRPSAPDPPWAPDSSRPGPLLRAVNLSRGQPLGERIEIAGDYWGKLMGLMGRPQLDDGQGLWLPGANGIHMMFMRFPIDAVFVGREHDGERTVLAVRESLPTWRGIVPLIRGAKGCLELPVGTIERSGTRVGDRIVLERA
jgi:uncharacterized membrane protein (UPF0127 family)